MSLFAIVAPLPADYIGMRTRMVASPPILLLGVIRDATRFLDRHPNAPQRTRVEQLRSQTAQE